MSRIDFIKAEWWRLACLIVLTALLPLLYPLSPLFGGVAALWWLGFILMMAMPDKARAEFFSKDRARRPGTSVKSDTGIHLSG